MRAKKWLGSLGFWGGVAIILGLGVVAFSVWLSGSVLAPKPAVGLVNISGDIDSYKAAEVIEMLRYVEEQDRIAGVVLDVGSFGGGVTPVDEIYLAVLYLREKKPVVVSVNDALSGAYHITVPANFIYAKPTSWVGNIGVWWYLPTPEKVVENLAATGPFKLPGFSVKETMEMLELMKESFLEAVIIHRGERLKVNREELSEAKVYTGIQALNNGLVDAIGARPDAVEKVAELAGLPRYEVIDINQVMLLKKLEEVSRVTGSKDGENLTDMLKFLEEKRAEREQGLPLPLYRYPYLKENR